MLEDIKILKSELDTEITSVNSMNELNDLRLKYLGKKSKIQEFSSKMKDLSIEEKKECGRLMNEFKKYAEQIIKNAKAFSEEFKKAGWKIISGGTDNHMFVLDVYSSIGVTGKEAEEELDKIHITVNKNQIPNDTLPPLQSSGVRIGTPAMTTKKWKEEHFEKLADVMIDFLTRIKEEKTDELYDEYTKKVMDIINSI